MPIFAMTADGKLLRLLVNGNRHFRAVFVLQLSQLAFDGHTSAVKGHLDTVTPSGSR